LSLASEDELEYGVLVVALDHILVVAADRHNLAGVVPLAIEHRQLAEDTAGLAAEPADHIEHMRHHFAAAEVVEYRVGDTNLDDQTDPQLAEARMVQLACHQGRHQLDHHYG